MDRKIVGNGTLLHRVVWTVSEHGRVGMVPDSIMKKGVVVDDSAGGALRRAILVVVGFVKSTANRQKIVVTVVGMESLRFFGDY